MEMKAEFSPASGGADADEASGKAIARASAASGKNRASLERASASSNDPSKQSPLRRLFQDDVFERAARRPMVSLG